MELKINKNSGFLWILVYRKLRNHHFVEKHRKYTKANGVIHDKNVLTFILY